MEVQKKNAPLTHLKQDIASNMVNRTIVAREKVLTLIRENYTVDSYEIVESFCNTLLGRMTYLSCSKECPRDLKEVVCSLIWAGDRLNVPELKEVKYEPINSFICIRSFY